MGGIDSASRYLAMVRRATMMPCSPRTSAIRLSVSGDFEALDETRGLALYRLVQESLTNIARHSKATKAEIRIAASRTAQFGQCIEILIADNGCGADMTAPQTGLGLVGMR